MRALILGMDGYLGWSLTVELTLRGHKVMGLDSELRRQLVSEEGSISAIKILELAERIETLNSIYLSEVGCVPCDVSNDYDILRQVVLTFKPDVVFHLGQIPSAPWSMKSRSNCLFTHQNNVNGTLNLLYAIKETYPDTHIIKIGTMGEYGQPNVPIPEGNSELSYGGYTDILPFPRAAGSWYHQTKVHDTHNIRMACNYWGVRCTDVMQGIVYGTRVSGMALQPQSLATRLDFDECFGTIINRFVVQSVAKHPMTVYGQGTQIRSILPLQDSINCLILLAENPPDRGEYREVNQFHECFSLNEMAERVYDAYYELTGQKPTINHISNPRIEKEKHFYQPVAKILKSLGYENSNCIEKVIRCMLIDILENRTILERFHSIFNPTVAWTGDVHQAKEICEN